MKKRKRVSLPRLTVLSMSRRELVAFVEAVEGIRYGLAELRQLVDELAPLLVAAGRRARPSRRPAATDDGSAAAADLGVPVNRSLIPDPPEGPAW